MPSSRALAALVLALTACAAPSPERAAASVAPPPAAPGPATASPATPAATQGPPSAPALPDLDLGLTLAAEGSARGDVAVYPLGAEPLLRAGATFAALRGDRFAPADAFARGLPRGALGALLGDGPAPVWAYVEACADGADRGALHRWDGKRWALVKRTRELVSYEGLVPLGAGRRGALVHLELDESRATWIEVLEGSDKPSAPRLARTPKDEPRLALFDHLTLSTGHLFALGPDTSDPAAKPMAVERWEPGAADGALALLPMPPGPPAYLQGARLAGASPDAVFVAATLEPRSAGPSTPYLARWDGRAWSLVDAPPMSPNEELVAAFTGKDGALFLLRRAGAEHALHRRAADGAWARARLPAAPAAWTDGVTFTQAGALPGGEAWLLALARKAPGSGDAPDRFALWLARPVAEPWRVADAKAPAACP
jgi:hypothetical protein